MGTRLNESYWGLCKCLPLKYHFGIKPFQFLFILTPNQSFQLLRTTYFSVCTSEQLQKVVIGSCCLKYFISPESCCSRAWIQQVLPEGGLTVTFFVLI